MLNQQRDIRKQSPGDARKAIHCDRRGAILLPSPIEEIPNMPENLEYLPDIFHDTDSFQILEEQEVNR